MITVFENKPILRLLSRKNLKAQLFVKYLEFSIFLTARLIENAPSSITCSFGIGYPTLLTNG
jgi:hypothetical protein